LSIIVRLQSVLSAGNIFSFTFFPPLIIKY
jgi:hypothetical protein